MAFKTDTSFLAKLTMGATANRAVMKFLADEGFAPIELERYSSSNKLWMTKVKRLRLPDLLCTQTGIRVEVRGKSKLEIKMSDSPTKPDRRWDSGARDEDLVALLPCRDNGERIEVRGRPTFLTVGSMRSVVKTSKLGPPKSASEGAERDRTWPCIVPKQDGKVVAVDSKRKKLTLLQANGRQQSYNLKGKRAYVGVGDDVLEGTTLLAGTPAALVNVRALVSRKWDPFNDLNVQNATDRYAAAKALGRSDQKQKALAALECALTAETEQRTALELAGSAARQGSNSGLAFLRRAVFTPAANALDYLAMEAILIMTEIASPDTTAVLNEIVQAPAFRDSELRQAAAWGIGKAGSKSYALLLPFLGDPSDDFAMHAIAAFGEDTPAPVVSQLVEVLREGGESRRLASAGAALVLIGSKLVAQELLAALSAASNPWLLAAFGSLPTESVSGMNVPHAVLSAVEPIRLLGPAQNWLAVGSAADSFRFLVRQSL